MFALIYCMVFGIILIQSYSKYQRIINVVSIFTFFWCFFGSIASLGITGYRIPSIEVNFYAVTFVLIVDEIVLLFSKDNAINLLKMYNRNSTDVSYNIGLIQLFLWILITPMAIKSLTVFFSTLNFSAVRAAFFGGGNFSSAYADLFLRMMPYGMLEGMVLTCIFFSFRNKQYMYLVMATIDTLILTVVSGGRYPIMLLLYSIVIMWINDQSNLFSIPWVQKYKKIIKRVGSTIFALLVILTINRGQAVFKSVVGYYAGSLSFFDYILEYPDSFALNQHMYGYMTFGFLLEPIVLFLKVLNLTDAKIPSYYFNIYCQEYYDVGDGLHSIVINANTSVLYYYFRDFGFLGVCVGAVIVGSLMVLFFNKWKSNESVFFGIMYLFMCNVLFNSIMTNQLFGMNPFFIALTIFLCTKTKKFPIEFKLKRN